MKMRKPLPTFESFSVNEAKFSIVQVSKQDGDKISGTWVQDHHGTLDSAIEKAIATEKANGNKLDYAVVDQISGATPNYDVKHGLKRLDAKRIGESKDGEVLTNWLKKHGGKSVATNKKDVVAYQFPNVEAYNAAKKDVESNKVGLPLNHFDSIGYIIHFNLHESVNEASKLVTDIKSMIKSKMGSTIDKAVSPKVLGVEGYISVDDYLKSMNISHRDNMLTIEMPSAHRSPRTMSPPTSKGVERVFTDLSKQAYDEIKKYLKTKGVSNFEDESIDDNSMFFLSDDLMNMK